MEVGLRGKLYNFKKSKINKVLNKINVILFTVSMVVAMAFVMMLVLVAGLSMWGNRGIKIESPLNRVLSNKNYHYDLYLGKIEEDNLFYEIRVNQKLDNQLSINKNVLDYEIYKVVSNGIDLELNEQNAYIIPSGDNELVFYFKALVHLETYNETKSFEIDIDREANIILSSEFRDDDLSERSSNKVRIFTSDSIGKYKTDFQRLFIYEIFMIILPITLIYTLINGTKYILLLLLTIGYKN